MCAHDSNGNGWRLLCVSVYINMYFCLYLLYTFSVSCRCCHHCHCHRMVTRINCLFWKKLCEVPKRVFITLNEYARLVFIYNFCWCCCCCFFYCMYDSNAGYIYREWVAGPKSIIDGNAFLLVFFWWFLFFCSPPFFVSVCFCLLVCLFACLRSKCNNVKA